MLLMSAKESAYRIKLLTQFAYKETDLLNCWQDLLRRITICFISKKLLICWFAELLTELVVIHAFVEFSNERQICWIADIICLLTTVLLNFWHNLLRDDKFAELLTKFADIMNLLLELLTINILAGSDWSTTLLKFSHHANLSVAGAEWSQSQIYQLECAWAGPSRSPPHKRGPRPHIRLV